MSNNKNKWQTNPLPEGDFLETLFSALNGSGINYAVMRNYHSLPLSAGGSDLDILVNAHDQDELHRVLLESVDLVGAVLLGTSQSVGLWKAFILGSNPEFASPWWGLRIDVNVGLFYKGLALLDVEYPLPISTYRSINVLADGFAGVLGVLKEVLNNGKIPERYLECARIAAESDWGITTKLLAPMGPDSLESLKRLMLNDISGPGYSCLKVRNHFYMYTFLKKPFSYFLGRIASLVSRIARYLKPSGTVIAILGTDGAGKSTIINAIKPALDQATHNATIMRHLRPNLLPPLSRIKGKTGESVGIVTDPHGSKPSGFVGSFVRLAYATVNYCLGYWLDTRKHIAKQPTVVVFDRYAYDMLLDQRRFRIALPTWLVRFFVWLAPKPDLIFCLHGDPVVLAARKNELPLAEVARQVQALKEFAASEPRAVLISTEGTVEQARDEILQALMEHARKKQANKR